MHAPHPSLCLAPFRSHGVLTRAGQIPDDLALDLGDVDRREVPLSRSICLDEDCMSCLLNIYPAGTGASLSILVQILVGLAATYLVAMVSESCQHRFVGRASVRTRRFWARNPKLCAHLLKAYYGHAVVHHGLTFRKNHVTQFVSVEEKTAVDRITERAADERIRAERYGLTVGLPAFVTYNLTVFPIVLSSSSSLARGRRREHDAVRARLLRSLERHSPGRAAGRGRPERPKRPGSGRTGPMNRPKNPRSWTDGSRT